jgi:hypothetical protein
MINPCHTDELPMGKRLHQLLVRPRKIIPLNQHEKNHRPIVVERGLGMQSLLLTGKGDEAVQPWLIIDKTSFHAEVHRQELAEFGEVLSEIVCEGASH